MGWVDDLRGKVVALDTAPLIYFIEAHPKYFPEILPFFQALDRGEFRAVTSTLTLLEVLVHPFRQKNTELGEQYRMILLNASNVSLIAVSATVAERAALLRSQFNLATPDAIQLAAALEAGASALLTNDFRFPTLPSLQIIMVDSLGARGSTPP